MSATEVLALDGLDGADSLHLLAALGAMALTTDLHVERGLPAPRLGWRQEGGSFVARLSSSLPLAAWLDALAERVRKMGAVRPDEGTPAARRQVDAWKKKEKDLAEEGKQLRKLLAEEAGSLGLKGADKKAHGQPRLDAHAAEVERVRRAREEAQEVLSSSLGFGPAHLGEIVAVPVGVFRMHAQHALANDPPSARQLAALASDGCVQPSGQVDATPFSFSNGSSGKCLLKDFRALAAGVTTAKLEASLVRGRPLLEDVTALNWSSRDLAMTAYQWSDPQRGKAQVDVVANALAYAGLGVLTCVPGSRDLEALGFERRRGGAGFVWCVWEPLLGLDLVRALLASGRGFLSQGAEAARARGVMAVFRAERINPTGKRNYFAPATRVG
jgi:hypothetical protein